MQSGFPAPYGRRKNTGLDLEDFALILALSVIPLWVWGIENQSLTLDFTSGKE